MKRRTSTMLKHVLVIALPAAAIFLGGVLVCSYGGPNGPFLGLMAISLAAPFAMTFGAAWSEHKGWDLWEHIKD